LLQVAVGCRGDETILRIQGEVGLATASQFSAALAAGLAVGAGNLVVRPARGRVHRLRRHGGPVAGRPASVRLLAAVEPHEVRCEAVHNAVVVAGEVAVTRSFDLDDAGAKVGEVAGGERAGDSLFERPDCDAVGEGRPRSRLRKGGADEPTTDDQPSP
jgi:hypothetical protein